MELRTGVMLNGNRTIVFKLLETGRDANHLQNAENCHFLGRDEIG
jgi:hypothetical protein